MAIGGIGTASQGAPSTETGVSGANRVAASQAKATQPRPSQARSNHGYSAQPGAQPLNTSGPRGTKVNIIA